MRSKVSADLVMRKVLFDKILAIEPVYSSSVFFSYVILVQSFYFYDNGKGSLVSDLPKDNNL